MKFSKYNNVKLLVFFIIISWIFTPFIVALKIAVPSALLIGISFPAIFYLVISIIYRAMIMINQTVEAKVKNYKYSLLAGMHIEYEFKLNGKKQTLMYKSSHYTPFNDKETLYIDSKNNIYRKKDITIFSYPTMFILLILFTILVFVAISINNISAVKELMWTTMEPLSIQCVVVFLEIFSIFPITVILMIYTTIYEEIRITDTVEGTVIYNDVINIEEEFPDFMNLNNVPVQKTLYRYIFNGNVYTYPSRTSSSAHPKIGLKKTLYVDKNGVVVRENGDVYFRILVGILALCLYAALLYGVLIGG